MQRDYVRRLRPVQLASAPSPPRPVRDLPVRVYVDDDYRSEVMSWRSRIEAQFERANRVLESRFAVRLAIKQIEPWGRSGRAHPLSDALEALVQDVPATGGEWVFGFVSSSAMVSGALEQCGLATFFGRHLVIRGTVSFAEGEAFRRSFDALSEAERDQLLRERELHREAAILLHEWAHTLGAFHERDPDTIMSPLYGRSESAFSGVAARIIQLGLERSASTAPGASAAWARDYRAEVERGRSTAWDAQTVEHAFDVARLLEAGLPIPGTRASAPDSREDDRPTVAAGARQGVGDAAPAPVEGDVAALAGVEMNERLGDAARAWKLVEPIAARFPRRFQLQQYACHLRRSAEPRARAAGCSATRPLSPLPAAILFARVLLEMGDRAGAAASLLHTEAAFAKGPAAAARREWTELANLLADVHACTAAERAAARVGARGALEACSKARTRAALPVRDAGVEPAREPEYVDAVLRARAHAEAGQVAAARTAAAALQSAFPDAPGGALVRCLVEAQGGDRAAARTSCSAADRGPPWPYEPPYVLGVLAGWDERWAEARDHLRRALDRDDADPQLWARLAAAHEKLGAAEEVEKLAARYRELFGKPLRPSW